MYKKLKDMNLKAGDVVVLRSWQDGSEWRLGERYKVNADITKAERTDGTAGWFNIGTSSALFEKEITTVDLSKITTPLGILKDEDPDTYNALIKHGGPYQCYAQDLCGKEYKWQDRTDIKPLDRHALAWRVKPEATEWFLNIYSTSVYAYDTREEADIASSARRLKCIRVVEAKD
jgi:hypothetical protein